MSDIQRRTVQERTVTARVGQRSEWTASHRQYSLDIDIRTSDGIMKMDAGGARAFAAALVELADIMDAAASGPFGVRAP